MKLLRAVEDEVTEKTPRLNPVGFFSIKFGTSNSHSELSFMTYIVQKQLPSAQEVLKKLPLSPQLEAQVAQDRKEIEAILSGKDERKLLIIGPCSAWPDTAVVQYAQKMKPLADQVSDKIKVVMRVYLQKPRTTVGWLGAMNQIDPYADPDIEKGIYYSRAMMLKVLEIGLPMADEAVFTHNDGYVVDLLSWVAIGARSTEDQEHRIFASMIDIPVGMKNPTSGNIKIGINSLKAAQSPHVFAIHGQQIQTAGNPYAHFILRGGDKKPNCGFEKLQSISKEYLDSELLNPSIIVDASHENCIGEDGQKNCMLQPSVVFDVLHSMKKEDNIKKIVKGFMVESYLKSGAQNVDHFSSKEELEYGKSITDGCLGWEETVAFVLDLRSKM